MGEMAILGAELAQELVAQGFELVETKRGKYITVYYFNDSVELEEALIEYNLACEKQRKIETFYAEKIIDSVFLQKNQKTIYSIKIFKQVQQPLHIVVAICSEGIYTLL